MNIKAKGSFPDTAGEKDKYETIKRERQEHVDKVVQSPSRKKIVVAGPGTGKTYLFKTILEGKENTLILTFVNALVEDLSLELCGVSDVRTLHSFARSVLKKVTQESIKIFPKVPQVIQEDARVLLNENIDFECLFDNRDDGNKHLQFYKNRKNYYGHYGFSEIVFEAVKHFESVLNKMEQVADQEYPLFNIFCLRFGRALVWLNHTWKMNGTVIQLKAPVSKPFAGMFANFEDTPEELKNLTVQAYPLLWANLAK